MPACCEQLPTDHTDRPAVPRHLKLAAGRKESVGALAESAVRRLSANRRGFTLIELLIVMAIIGTLLSIAVPRYFRSLEHARETVVKQDLAILREAIDKYYADLNQYPEKLADLTEKRYVRSLPVDPFTKLADTWTVILSEDPDNAGIRDIHSGAADTASDGTPVAAW